MSRMHSGMKYIPNRDAYLEFIEYINKYYFHDTQATEEFFGFELMYDEDTGEYMQGVLDYNGDIEHCPDSFPAIVYYCLDDQPDTRGGGNWSMRMLDYEPITSLGIEVASYKKPAVKRCNWNILSVHRECKHDCDGYCSDCEDYWVDGNYLGFTFEQLEDYYKNAED